ncbi:MAG: malto-oligosyltrehalose synthase, partial [Flavisolibacter sp.]
MIDLVSTYRFQFHKDFTLHDLGKIIPYLTQLGIGTVYASPVFESVPGSTHGYDGVNPNRIDPEIGSVEDLLNISEVLRRSNIKWLQDIVPNHMAFDHRNSMLMDVLEKGRQSKYASWFDIVLTDKNDRIMVPFLGDTLDAVIRKGELKIIPRDGRFYLVYYDSSWPVSPQSYRSILEAGDETLPGALRKFLDELSSTNDEMEPDWQRILLSFRNIQENEVVWQYIDHCTGIVNKDPLLIQQVADQQCYRLCHWKETDERINYRRFFTVNGLICMNMQDQEVFDEYHNAVNDLVDRNVFQGLRVDHIDGLYNPGEYLRRLRSMAGIDIPVYVEKILEPGESLLTEWPVQGNTGYDFLSLVNNLFTNQQSEKKFTSFYRDLTKNKKTVEEQVYEKKAYILENHMNGELDNLYDLFMGMDVIEKKEFASMRSDEVKQAIGAFLVACPVYRFYGNRFPLEEEEALHVKDLLQSVAKWNPELKKAVGVLENVLLKIPLKADVGTNKRIAHFYSRCMQFSGPLMAKGVEDTLMYTYHRFIGHNEVGDGPSAFGITIDEFHHAMIERRSNWPYSINTTSTHDTKRGEDVRARLNVLTDVSDDWMVQVDLWLKMNENAKTEGGPDRNDEYFIYQVLAGATPLDGVHADKFPERIKEYFQKALREAKSHSNWAEPDEKYEKAVEEFITRILDSGHPFFNSLCGFLNGIFDHGIINSL